jgi:cytochrome c oxidase assembly protein subunit 11
LKQRYGVLETERGSMIDPAEAHDDRSAPIRRKRWTAMSLAVLALAMGGLSFAAVPLYRLFCEVTGFSGMTQIAEAVPKQSEQRIMVRFDANVAAGMPWIFEAPKPVELALREAGLVAYGARNPTRRPILGTATFNVAPQRVGVYFNKIQCFCFTEQLLVPGEKKEFPVTFFVDPAFEKDRELRTVATITLSYTFFDKGPEALNRYMASHGIEAAEVMGEQ